MLDRMATPEAILAANIAAARVRRDLQQQDLAERMRALGWKWVRQTVGEVEKKEQGRRVTPGELVGLAIALETSVTRLTSPLPEDREVELPSGLSLRASAVQGYVTGEWVTDERILWHQNKPVHSRGSGRRRR